MKWLIASDIHGSRNDLPEEYAPREVAAMLNGIKSRIYAVRGNYEAEVDQMMLEFPVMAEYILLPVGERMIFATHGHTCPEGFFRSGSVDEGIVKSP